jgi:hypothetical protein
MWRVLIAVLLVAIVATAADPIGSSAEAQVSVRHGRGPVRLDGRALADNGGPWLPLGASLFWALWGEQHDPERLDANLAWLAERGVDYVRVLGMVGADSWSDRRVDPRAPDYWETVDRLFARLARHGLRVEVTIFADAQVMMPRRTDRQAFVDRWAAYAEANRARVVLLEVANEYRQNGLEDVDELRALARRLARGTRVLVAISSASTSEACRVYAGSAADLATVHYPRAWSPDNPWEAVGQPWGWPGRYDAGCRGRLPVAVNNEPIGPQSSVEADEDPGRLVMAYVTTFVAGNAAYVLHTGAGIRGGGAADLAAGRAADFADVPGLVATLAGIERTRRYLPGDLSNWRRRDGRDPTLPLTGLSEAVRAGALTAVYATTSRTRFVAVVMGARRDVVLRARTGLVVEMHEPVGDAPARRVELGAGERLTLRGADAYILTGASVDR